MSKNRVKKEHNKGIYFVTLTIWNWYYLFDRHDRWQILVDSRKLTHYALDPESPYGKHKAILFEKMLGFTRENYEGLITQIRNKALHTEIFFHSEDQFGKRYNADIEIEGIAENQKAIVRTGWLVANKDKKAHLTTLYIIRR